MATMNDLRYATRLTKEEMALESDLIPVWHPSAGPNSERTISLADLRTLVSSTMTGVTGASVFQYKADASSQTMSDPGTGKVRWNANPQINSSRIAFDWITTDGFDPVLLFQSIEVGDTFTIQDADLSINNQVWKKLGPATNMPDWFYVDVQLVSSAGNPQMKNNGGISVLLQIGQKIQSSAGQVVHNRAGTLLGSDNLVFDGKTLRMPLIPTSSVGLPSGSLWNNAGVLNIVP